MKAVCIILLCCLPLLSQCASWRFTRLDCAAHPAPLASQLWPQSLRAVHQLQLQGEHPHQLWVVVRRDAERLNLQALNPLGIELFRLDWRDNQLSSHGPASALENFDIAMLVADFQLVHWPLERLQAAWLDSAWQLKQSGSIRRLSCAGVAVSEVQYPPADQPSASIVLSNLLAGYRLEILNLEMQPAATAAHP